MRISIDGLEFTDAPTQFDEQYVIEPRGLTGWYGAAGIRREETQRPAAHGSFDAPGYRGAKVPFIRGSILASTDSMFQRLRLNLESLLADGDVHRMTVQDGALVTWQDVRLASPAVVDPHPNDPSGEFQIGFWSPRAEIYGEERTYTGASVQVFHRGTIRAPFRVRITDAPASYTITGPGRTFEVAGATSGGTHEVDMRTGRVTRNGVLMVGVVQQAATWDIPAGNGWALTCSVSAEWLVRDTYA